MPDVSVCVAVYREHAAPNLASLAAALPAALEGLDWELVVALNGMDAARAGAPANARCIDLGVNLGVAPGWNAAARAATGDVLCFANDDLEPGPGSIATLTRVLRERTDAGVVGPAGSRWDIAGGRHLSDVSPADATPGDLTACEVVSGFLFACRRETYAAVGGFDDYYAPFSWEEVDFCTAVRASGLRCYRVAGVEHAHEWGVSQRQPPWRRARWDGRSQSIWWIHRRNRRHFLAKWSATELAPI
jgi:GT2 family glycosyltransferase